MNEPIRPLRSYRAILWPPSIEAADVGEHAAKGALPTLRVKAYDADHAALLAAHATGQHVLQVERIEPEETCA